MSDAIEKARAEGAKAERDRIRSILTCAGVQGREAKAITLALADGMTAAAAVAVLSNEPGSNEAAEFEFGREIGRTVARSLHTVFSR
jgi:hypothetical protein